jgi:hypothetical protein
LWSSKRYRITDNRLEELRLRYEQGREISHGYQILQAKVDHFGNASLEQFVVAVLVDDDLE